MIGAKKVVAVTLARSGSKTIPHKNIALLNGKPLLQYTIDACLKSKYIDEYYVSSDDIRYLNFSIGLGAKIIERPAELATDTSTSASALKHALSMVDCDIFVEVMCTNPLKTSQDIDACIELLDDSCDSVVSVVRLYDHHPSRVKYIEDGVLKDFYPEVPESRRQDLEPPAYARNGSIYAMHATTLIAHGNRLGKRCRPYIMPSERTINIDEPSDLLVAQEMMK